MLSTITVDVGTTSVKLSAFDESGVALREDRIGTPTAFDAVGEVYDVDALEGAVAGFTTSLPTPVRHSIRRIAFAGVGESGGLVRPDASLASPIVLWHDQRGAALLDALTDEQRWTITTRTGLPANANYGVSKAAWALRHAADASGAQWLNVSEFLAARLTGRRWSEYSLASRTMALDLVTNTWSPAICAMFGIGVDTFPELLPATVGVPISPEAAGRLGLSAEVVVHVAGHDHMVGGVGAGLRRGDLLNSTGTTEGLLVLRDEPALDDATLRAKLANGRATVGDDFTLFASIPTGGSAFQTLQAMLEMSAERLSAITEELHDEYLAGAIDLTSVPLVLPQFRGSPPPEKRASARGVVSGIASGTTAKDIVLGAFLGLALQFRDVLDLFPSEPAGVQVIGPATKNRLWVQLKADVLGRPVSVATAGEVVSRGAQMIASGHLTRPAVGPDTSTMVDPSLQNPVRGWADDVRDRWEALKGMS